MEEIMDCNQCAGEPLPNEATHHYVWAWGEEGNCCDPHRASLLQLAEKLQRTIDFTPLGPPATPEHVWKHADLEKALAMATAELQAKIAQLEQSDERIRQQDATIARLELELSTVPRAHST
jgi:hypothetical protein